VHGELPVDVPLERFEPMSQLAMARDGLAQRDERAHDENAHLDRARSVQHRCGHDRAVLGERERLLAPAAST
jgi:hypothetical protein